MLHLLQGPVRSNDSSFHLKGIWQYFVQKVRLTWGVLCSFCQVFRLYFGSIFSVLNFEKHVRLNWFPVDYNLLSSTNDFAQNDRENTIHWFPKISGCQAQGLCKKQFSQVHDSQGLKLNQVRRKVHKIGFMVDTVWGISHTFLLRNKTISTPIFVTFGWIFCVKLNSEAGWSDIHIYLVYFYRGEKTLLKNQEYYESGACDSFHSSSDRLHMGVSDTSYPDACGQGDCQYELSPRNVLP